MNRRLAVPFLAGLAALVILASFSPALATALATGLAPPARGAGAQKPASARSFQIDPVHSTAIFRVHHMGAGQFYGRFNQVQGSFSFAEGSASELAFDVRIPIESVDTHNARRDGDLKGADFFNAREFPEMRFVSDSARRVDKTTYEITGKLTLHGTTKPLTTKVQWTGAADGRMGYRCGFETIFTIQRSDFGISYLLGNGMVGDEVRVIVSMEGVRR